MRKPCIYSRNGKWLIATWDDNDKRHDRVVGRGPEAEAKARQIKADLDKRIEQGAKDALLQGPTLEQAVNAYIRNLGAKNKTREHMKSILSTALGVYYPLLGKNTPIRSMTYADTIVPFINHLRNSKSRATGKQRAEATVNRYCCYLRSIFNYAVQIGNIDVSPLRPWHKSKEMPRLFYLDEKGFEMISKAASPHIAWAMEVAYNTGVRPGPSELLSLRWEDVNFDKGVLTVKATKTRSIRRIPLKPKFLEHLLEKRTHSKSGYIVEYKGMQVLRIQKAFRMAVKRSGVTYPVRLYDLRHMFATYMLTHGADLAAVSYLMGHASVKMTADIYYQYLEGEKERAIACLPDLPMYHDDDGSSGKVA